MADTASSTSMPNKLLTAIRRLRWRLGAPTKIAILIDGDNVSPKIVPALFNHIARIGDPIVRRVYVNVTGRVISTENVPARMIPALVITGPVAARARSIPSLVPHRRASSRTRLIRKIV